MTLVLLTHGSDYADHVLMSLSLRGVGVDAIFVVRAARKAAPRRTLRSVVGRALRRRVETNSIDWAEYFRGMANRVEDLGTLDRPAVAERLRESQPTWVVLADTGILPPSLLSIPTRGTLNAHPALLPWARGVSVIERSLERGVPIGATVHLVDEGIDTGPLVRRVLVPATEHDTLFSLRRKATARSAELLADVVAGIARGREPLPEPQSARIPYGRWVTYEERERIAGLVRGGLAHRLFREWREFYDGDEIPLEDRRLPPTLALPR